MKNIRTHLSIGNRLRSEAGAVSVEFAIVIALFFFVFLVLFDFGRIAFSQVMAEKATHLAARTAIVRAPVCTGVPNIHSRGTEITNPSFGTSCSATGYSGQICIQLTVSCDGSASNATALEIWDRVSALLPPNAQIEDFTYSYVSKNELGFLGGPFTPMVTVELDLGDYTFISPLGALSTIAGAISPALGNSFDYPVFSVSLPAEDLALGNDG
ncbi:MAG: TadE/TadG family type IV pilus assembly protein [Paracoccaceae bacterium]